MQNQIVVSSGVHDLSKFKIEVYVSKEEVDRFGDFERYSGLQVIINLALDKLIIQDHGRTLSINKRPQGGRLKAYLVCKKGCNFKASINFSGRDEFDGYRITIYSVSRSGNHQCQMERREVDQCATQREEQIYDEDERKLQYIDTGDGQIMRAKMTRFQRMILRNELIEHGAEYTHTQLSLLFLLLLSFIATSHNKKIKGELSRREIRCAEI